MNFIEAVTELAEGRCKGIRIGESAYKATSHGITNTMTGHGIHLHCDDFCSTDWQLVDPVPQYEDVEVVRFECNKCGCVTKILPVFCNEPLGAGDECCSSHSFTKLIGTYRREVKPKVKRRVPFTIIGHAYTKQSDTPIANNAAFYAEWEE